MYVAISLTASIITIAIAIWNVVVLITGKKQPPDQSIISSTLRSIGKFLNFIFSVLGTVAIIIIAIEVVLIVLAPKLVFIDQIQEKIALNLASKIAPSVTNQVGSPAPDPSVGNHPTGTSAPMKTPFFSVELSPATLINDVISVKAVIENTTTEPLYITLNASQRPILTDDKFGYIYSHYRHSGIGWGYTNSGGAERDVKKYTQILPNQRLDIGLKFSGDSRGTSERETTVHVTIDFIILRNGKVERVSATPGTTMTIQ